MFKIRNAEGLFSSGGMDITWSKTGKTWRTMGHVNSHLNHHLKNKQWKTYDGTEELIEYEMVEIGSTSLGSAIFTKKTQKIKDDRRKEESRMEQEIERLTKEKKKLEDRLDDLVDRAPRSHWGC